MMMMTTRSFRLGSLLLAASALALSACQSAADAPGAGEQSPRGGDGAAFLALLNPKTYNETTPLASCGVRALSSRPQPAALGPALAEAEAYHDKYRGTALIVMHQGAVIYERYGHGADAQTRAPSQSMMKSVLGLLYGIALDKGLIGSASDPIGLYLPEWREDPRGAITIAEMLQMTSGLEPANFAKLMGAKNVNAAALEAQLIREPGSVFEYDSAVSQILENILDRQAKAKGYQGFADFMQRELWCPLGSDAASLWVDRAGNPHGFAGLNATARDWARIGELIRARGAAGETQIVAPGWVEAMQRPSPANPQYGYQLWLGGTWSKQRVYNSDTDFGAPQREPFVAKDTVFFDGFGGLRVYIIPSRELTIVRLGKMTLKYDETVIPNALTRALDGEK